MKDAAKKRSDAFLQPLIDDLNAPDNYGSRAELIEALENVTGEKVYRQRVERWLSADPAKRVQPLLGAGLLLVEVWKRKRRTKKGTR